MDIETPQSSGEILFSEEIYCQKDNRSNKAYDTHNIGRNLKKVTTSFLEVCIKCRSFTP